MIEVHCLLKIEQLCVKIQGRVGGNVYTIVDVDLCCKTCAVTVSFLSSCQKVSGLPSFVVSVSFCSKVLLTANIISRHSFVNVNMDSFVRSRFACNRLGLLRLRRSSLRKRC